MTATTNGPDIVPVPRKATGRPALTSRASLLSAARSHGFRGLTVGKVTAARYVKYSTFYRHFSSIGALTAVLVDDVLGEVTIPTLSDWREQAQVTTDVLRAVLAAHPGMADAIAHLEARPTWISDARAALRERMVHAGIEPKEAAAGVNAVFTLALAEPGQVGWREIALVCDGIAGGAGEK